MDWPVHSPEWPLTCSLEHGMPQSRMVPHCQYWVWVRRGKLAKEHLSHWGRDVGMFGEVKQTGGWLNRILSWTMAVTCCGRLAKPLALLGWIFPGLKIRDWTGLSSCFIPYSFVGVFPFWRHNPSLSSASFYPRTWKDSVNGRVGVGDGTQVFFYCSFIQCVKTSAILPSPKDCGFRNTRLTWRTQTLHLAGMVEPTQLLSVWEITITLEVGGTLE